MPTESTHLLHESLQLTVLNLVEHVIAVHVQHRKLPVQHAFVVHRRRPDDRQFAVLSATAATLVAESFVLTVEHADQVRIEHRLIVSGATATLPIDSVRRNVAPRRVLALFLAVRFAVARRRVLDRFALGVRAPAATLVHALDGRVAAVRPASWHEFVGRRVPMDERVGTGFDAFGCCARKSVTISLIQCF